MSETQIPKLNLKAIKPIEKENIDKKDSKDSLTSKGETSENIQKGEDTQVESPATKEQDHIQTPKPLKISFNDIRKDVPESPSGEVEQENDTQGSISKKIEKKEEESTTISNENIVKKNEDFASIGDKKTKEEEKQEKKSIEDKIALENENKTKNIIHAQEGDKKQKRGLFSFIKKRSKENKKETRQKDQNTEDLQQESKKEEIHFDNYESHFKKESSNILNRFRQFKYAPKTRIGLVLGLISITACSIGGLMVVFPEKHSPGIYKASILHIINKGNSINDVSSLPGITESEQTTEQEIDNQTLDTTSNKTKSDIQKKQESKEKLRQHLLDKYSS